MESVINPQQPTSEALPVISKSDIKQYDFHSSDEDEFPQVINSTPSCKHICLCVTGRNLALGVLENVFFLFFLVRTKKLNVFLVDGRVFFVFF